MFANFHDENIPAILPTSATVKQTCKLWTLKKKWLLMSVSYATVQMLSPKVTQHRQQMKKYNFILQSLTLSAHICTLLFYSKFS